LFFFALAGRWLLAACDPAEPKEGSSQEVDSAHVEALGYQMIDTILEFIVEDGNQGYVRIEIEFPHFYGPDLSDDLNRLIDSKLWAQARTTDRTWQEQITCYVDQYKQMQAELGYTVPWTHKESRTIRRFDDEVLTLERDYNDYSGGAHGRHETHYYNFDVQTGDTLLLDDIIKPGAREPVQALVDFHYREQEGLAPDASLTTDGILSVESIPLTENFSLEPKGIRFYYNPYEIAAYAAGAIIIEVPKSDLESYLK